MSNYLQKFVDALGQVFTEDTLSDLKSAICDLKSALELDKKLIQNDEPFVYGEHALDDAENVGVIVVEYDIDNPQRVRVEYDKDTFPLLNAFISTNGSVHGLFPIDDEDYRDMFDVMLDIVNDYHVRKIKEERDDIRRKHDAEKVVG